MEHELLKKSHPVLFRTKAEVFAFLEAERERFQVSRLCALYGVTRAGYNAWRGRNEWRYRGSISKTPCEYVRSSSSLVA